MEHHRVIAIGGSTGAIEALRTICANLPADLPAAVFIVVHVGTEGRDLLAGILDGLCPLPVQTARDGQDVQPGHVYVAPADHHLLVIDSVIRLGRGPRENMTRPAIDPLFRSVGESYGPRAIGLVLTGKLNDGASGLADLKRCGGVTVVQSPTDALAPDMPLGALQASDIDYRASLADLGPLLATLAAEEPGPRTAVPRRIALEIDIALGRPCLTRTIAQMGRPVALTCPQCAGVLSEIDAGLPLRFRCQVGHAFTAEVVADTHQNEVDDAIVVALRVIEERAYLVERMAQDAERSNRPRSASDFFAKAQELRGHADVLRDAALAAS
jgi:two-component system chemotaxis response regulator CheB